MELTAIILVIISAFFHAGWNLAGKRQHPSAGFFLLASSSSMLLLSPVALFYLSAWKSIPAPIWGMFVLTGLFQSGYYASLAGAYRSGDMSVAYPLARSSPLIVVTVVAVFLGRGDQISLQCLVGIFLVVGGCFILPMRHFRDFRLKNYFNKCCFLALLAAVGTSGYSIIDDEALRQLRSLPDAPFNRFALPAFYLFFMGLFSSIFLSTFVLINSKERNQFKEVTRFTLRRAILIGVCINVTYFLVLASMEFAQNISYIVAFRQLSIPLGAICGVFILKEPAHRPKFAGVFTIFVGLVLVGLG